MRFAAGVAAFAAGFGALRAATRRPEVDPAAGLPLALTFAALAGLRFAPALFLCLVSLAMQSRLRGPRASPELRARPDRQRWTAGSGRTGQTSRRVEKRQESSAVMVKTLIWLAFFQEAIHLPGAQTVAAGKVPDGVAAGTAAIIG